MFVFNLLFHRSRRPGYATAANDFILVRLRIIFLSRCKSPASSMFMGINLIVVSNYSLFCRLIYSSWWIAVESPNQGRVKRYFCWWKAESGCIQLSICGKTMTLYLFFSKKKKNVSFELLFTGMLCLFAETKIQLLPALLLNCGNIYGQKDLKTSGNWDMIV